MLGQIDTNIWLFDGNPTNAPLDRLNAPKGATVIDRQTGESYQKTSGYGDNSGFMVSGTGAGGKSLVVDSVFGTIYGSRQGAPFSTIVGAVAASSSGDLTTVRPGTYNELGLMKTGTFQHYETGAIVAYTGADVGPVFWDNAGAITMRVTGNGVFTNTSANLTGAGVILQGNAGSNCYFEGNTFGSATSTDSCINHAGGRLEVKARDILSKDTKPSVYWFNGELDVTATNIIGGTPVYSVVTATATGPMRIEANLIKSTGVGYTGLGTAIEFLDTDAGARSWIDAFEIVGHHTAILFGDLTGGGTSKWYVTADKISRTTPAGAPNDATIIITAGESWVDAMKLTLPNSSGSAGILIAGGNVLQSWMDFQHLECLGTVANIVDMDAALAVINLHIGAMTTTANTGGMKLLAGTLDLHDSIVDTSLNAGTSPISATSAATISFRRGVELKSHASAASVVSSDASAVVVTGKFFANTAVGANVTARDGYTLAVAAKTTVEVCPVGTVAALPALAAGTVARTFVSDSNAAMTAGIGAIVAGSGANVVPVYWDGTNWRIG